MDRTQNSFALADKAGLHKVKFGNLLKGFLWFLAASALCVLLLWASVKYGMPLTEDSPMPQP
jgi:hypothetical protein